MYNILILIVLTFSCFLNNYFALSFFDAAINPPIAGLGASIFPSSAANLNIGLLNPAVSVYQAFEPRLSNPMVM